MSNMDIQPRMAQGQTGRLQTAPKNTKKFGKAPKVKWIAAAIILVVIIAGGAWWYLSQNSSQVDSSKYQAVFLENNQVYFGKLHGYEGSHPYLTNVWYIQAPDATSGGGSATSPTSLQLMPLTKYVYGPENEMLLNKTTITNVENLSSDSQVTKLINSNK